MKMKSTSDFPCVTKKQSAAGKLLHYSWAALKCIRFGQYLRTGFWPATPLSPPCCLPFEAMCNWPNSGHKFDLLFYFALRLNEAAGKWGLPIAAEQINKSRMVGNLALAKDSIIDVCVLFWGFFSSPRCPSISNGTIPPLFQRFLH